MNIKEHQSQQADRASSLADALGEFLEATVEYREAMTSWNESNAKENSSRWQQLEQAVDEADKPRQAAAKNLLVFLEDLVGIRYTVVRADQ